MSLKLKPVSEQVIVITGATSGIGLATAKRAAAKGARLVLASRSEETLAKVEQEIRASGGEAIHVVADVADRKQLENVASAALQKYGRIDTWVNDAGIGLWGKLEQISDEDHRRMFETNFWGVVNGSLIAARHLKQSGGAIINLGSVASDMAFPLQTMYAATKHAIKGFTDGLRQELEAEKAPISVTLIKPSAIGTPFGNDAKNYMDKEPQLPPPIYAVEEVAAAIVYAAAHPKRDIYIGGGGRMFVALNKVAPRFMDKLSEKILIKQELKDEPARPRHDNLHQSASRGETTGHDLAQKPRRSVYTRAVIHPRTTAGIVGGLLALTAGAAALATGKLTPKKDLRRQADRFLRRAQKRLK